MSIVRLDKGARMSEAVIHGNTVYLAGQVAEGADVATQTRAVLANIDALLARAGSSKANILSATIWLADMADFAEMNSVWDAWVDKENPPAAPPAKASSPRRSSRSRSSSSPPRRDAAHRAAAAPPGAHPTGRDRPSG